MRGLEALVLIGSFMLAACGGSTPPAEEPAPEPAAVDSADDVEQTAAAEKESNPESEPSAEAAKTEPAASAPAPEFKEGMSVAEATKAVPSGADTLNIEQEALARPLMEGKVYEPCKLGNSHFKLKVAVWDGKAVGIDVTTTPKSDKLSQCIKGQVSQLEWPDKVKSLNTVEYAL